MKTFLKIIIASYLLILSSLTLAQIPETQYSENIAYITGGVGEGETKAILSEAKQWPLLLELSQLENGRGVWIFGAKIKIVNAKKQAIFDAQADGPYMLINLDSGAYTIEASFQGVEQKRAIVINAGSPQKIEIFWR